MKHDEPALRAATAALGPRFDPEILQASRALYSDAIRPAPAVEVRADIDLRYGPAERHRLDLYRGPGSGLPVVLFVHGGGFVAGDKGGQALFYGNIGRYFAAHGCVGVVMTYRLAPADPWPAGAEDVGRVVRWLRQNAAEHGGDPERIVVLGQSAGASHVASWLFDERIGGRPAEEVRAVSLMSGFYRAKAPLGGGPLAYFGADPALYADRSPLSHVRATPVPLLVSVAEYDPPWIGAQSFELAAALFEANGRSPRFAWLDGHNHVSSVLSLGSVQDDVGAGLRAFVAANT